MKSFIMCFFMLMAATGVLRADPITFEATVNTPRLSLDEVLQLTLTVTGVNENLDPINLPVLDGFSAKYLGPSTSVSIVNGDYHSERSFIYNLFPNKIGHFEIPPISATIAGQTYTTKPIDVEVFASTAQAQASSPPDQNQAPTADSLKERIMMMVSIGTTQAYLNQGVPLTVKLLVNDVPMRDIQFPQFDKTGFSADDFDKPEQNSQVINGVKYDTVEFKTNIYPNRLGDLSIGPIQIQGNILYKTGQGNPLGDNGVWGAEVFNNFFDSYATRPVTVTSQPIILHVSPLPEANRPADFSGAIGQFDFHASVSPLQVKAGDPLTLKMDVQGSGNFKNMKMPMFQFPGFKTYEPQIKGTGDEKTAEEVIIPTSADIKEVPALHFSYFDTSLRDYKTVTQGPFAIQVEAPSPDQEFKAVGFADVSRETAMSSPNSLFWSKVFNQLTGILRKLYSSIWFWTGLGFLAAAGISYFLWRRFQYRLENDPAFARRLKAVREAKKALDQAQGFIAGGQTKEFYALLSKVLRDYLANKWHQSSAALSIEEIIGQLKAHHLDDTFISQFKTLLEQSDLVCFAGAGYDVAQMNKDLSKTYELIARLEKFLK